MTLDKLLEATRPYFLLGEGTFQSPGEKGYALSAQWHLPIPEDLFPSAPQLIYEFASGNPRRVWIVTWSGNSQSIRMLVTEHLADSRSKPVYSRRAILGLELIRHGAILQPVDRKQWYQYPNALQLLTSSKNHRLTAGPALVKVGEMQSSRVEANLTGSLHSEYREWLDWIADWEQTKNRAILVSLCAVLYHELFKSWTTWLSGLCDIFWTSSHQGNGRIVMRAACRALRRLERIKGTGETL